MINVLVGKEYYLMKEKEREIIKKSKIDNIIIYDFEDINIKTIIEEMLSIDLFNNKKIVIVNNFDFKSLEKDDEELFCKYIDTNNENILIIKSNIEKLDERKKIVKLLREKCEVYEAKKLSKIELTTYILNMLKINGFKTNEYLVKKIINACNYSNYSDDNGYIFNEVNKLMIYCDNKVIDETAIEYVVSKNTENEIFDFTSVVIKRNKDDIFNEFKIIKNLLIDPYYIISMLAKQYRTLFQIKILKEDKIDNITIANKLGINPYIVELQLNNINLYTVDELSDIMHKLFEIDLKMKSETIDYYRLIERFLLEI